MVTWARVPFRAASGTPIRLGLLSSCLVANAPLPMNSVAETNCLALSSELPASAGRLPLWQ